MPAKSPSPPLKTGRFLRSQRLVRRADYLRIQENGKRFRTPHFVLMVLPGSKGRRLGITVTSKIGCAARRNRIKRIAREAFRRNRDLFPRDCDIVVVARLGAYQLGYAQVVDELKGVQKAFTEYTQYNNQAPIGG